MPFFKLILGFLVITSLNSCLKSTYFRRMNADAIPQDIRDPKYILLVEGWSTGGFAEGNTRRMKEAMSKNYPSRFEMVNAEDTSSPKYADKSVYRYYMRFGFTSVTRTDHQQNGRTVRSTHSAVGVLNFFDRLANKSLGNTREEMQNVLKNLKFFGQYVEKNR